MLVASGADLDPVLFQKGNETEFGILIGSAAHTLESADETISLHDGFDPLAAGQGMMREMEEHGGRTAEIVEELSGMVGEDFMSELMGQVLDVGPAAVSDKDYEEAVVKKGEAGTTLIDGLVGYQGHLRTNLALAYGQDGEDVNEEAWLAAWKRLKDILGGEQGTLLATTAGFFDGLVREKFGQQFKPMERDRGPAIAADVCASTFYEVMQDHVPRAIIGANRDEWTGYS